MYIVVVCVSCNEEDLTLTQERARRERGRGREEREREIGREGEITVEAGSRGMLGSSDLEPLAAAISCPRKDIETLCRIVIRTTLLESFKIWCSRNTVT